MHYLTYMVDNVLLYDFRNRRVDIHSHMNWIPHPDKMVSHMLHINTRHENFQFHNIRSEHTSFFNNTTSLVSPKNLSCLHHSISARTFLQANHNNSKISVCEPEKVNENPAHVTFAAESAKSKYYTESNLLLH